MSGLLRFVFAAVFALVFGAPGLAVAQERGSSGVYVGGVQVRSTGDPSKGSIDNRYSRSMQSVGSNASLGGSELSNKLNGGIGAVIRIPGVGTIGGSIGNGGGIGGIGGIGGVGGVGGVGGFSMGGAGAFNQRSFSLACAVLSIPEGAFGALLMVVSGLMAVIGAALGMYKLALSTLIVGIGSFLIQPIVSLFFGGFGCW